MSAEQTIQEVSIAAFMLIEGAADLTQSIQQLSASATNYNPTAQQGYQSVNAQAFERIDASASMSQATSALSANGFVYHIAITGSMSQAVQSLSASAYYQYIGAGIVQQAAQTLSAYGSSMVITSPEPRNLLSDYRILRAVRNKGSR